MGYRYLSKVSLRASDAMIRPNSRLLRGAESRASWASQRGKKATQASVAVRNTTAPLIIAVRFHSAHGPAIAIKRTYR